MANEITGSGSLSLVNGLLKTSQASGNVKITQNNASFEGGTQSIGTTEEAITIGDLVTEGWAWLRNSDATNFLQIGLKPASVFYPLMDLYPSEPPSMFRITPGVTLYAKSDTADCELIKLILED